MEVAALATFWATHLAAVASPGPSFVVVSQASARDRRAGVRIALGLTLGTFVWATAAWFGLSVAFERYPAIYGLTRIAGALFLAFIAIQVWRHADEPLPPACAPTAGDRSVRLGFATQMANPKVVVFFGSVFAAILPPAPGPAVVAAAFAIVCANEFAWYAGVALLLSRPAMRERYGRWKPSVDRATAALLALIAAGLLAS